MNRSRNILIAGKKELTGPRLRTKKSAEQGLRCQRFSDRMIVEKKGLYEKNQNKNEMKPSKKKTTSKAKVTFKDLKSKKNPKGGFQYDTGLKSGFKVI